MIAIHPTDAELSAVSTTELVTNITSHSCDSCQNVHSTYSSQSLTTSLLAKPNPNPTNRCWQLTLIQKKDEEEEEEKTGWPAAAWHWWDTEQTSAADHALAETTTLRLVHADARALPTHQHSSHYLLKPLLVATFSFYFTSFLSAVSPDWAGPLNVISGNSWRKQAFYRPRVPAVSICLCADGNLQHWCQPLDHNHF